MRKMYKPVDITQAVKEKIMALSEVETQEELINELNELERVRKEERKKMIVGWTVSLCVHGVVALLLTTIAFATLKKEEVEYPPFQIAMMDPPTIKPNKDPLKKDLIDKNIIVEVEKETNDKGVVSDLKVPTIDFDTTQDNVDIASEVNKGREEAKSDMEMGSVGFNAGIGVGGGGKGIFGNRIGVGKNKAKAKMGPWGKSSESAVEAGLRWLTKHQNQNGSWDAEKYYLNCTDGLKCEPGRSQAGDSTMALTGYAVLCFLGAGYDHQTPSRYKSIVKKGIQYIVSMQKPEGLLGERNYEHPVATMALVEAYGMTGDISLKPVSQKALDVITKRQTVEKANDPYGKLLWDYVNPNINRADISVSGWNIMAVKSAIGAGLNDNGSHDGAKKAIERVWKASNPEWEKKIDPYTDTTVFPYTWNATTNKTEKDYLSFVGATCAVFLGHKSGDIMLETLMNDCEKRWVDSGAYKNNAYAEYYLGMASFQCGGDRWKKYLDTVIPYCISQQVKSEDCLNGSWSANGQGFHGASTGRVLITTYNILNLEVAYRYVQVNGAKPK
jgi:hypothetical protein